MTKDSNTKESFPASGLAADQKELNMKCALCQKKAVRSFRPFCSKRCKDVDLGNWFTGRYIIPGDTEHEKINEGALQHPDS